MTVEFDAIVSLVRLAKAHEYDAHGLKLELDASVDVARCLDQAASWSLPTVFDASGKQVYGKVDRLAQGMALKLHFVTPPIGTSRGIFASLNELLSYQGGMLQHKPFAEYFLVAEDALYSDELANDSLHGKYKAALLLLSFLKWLADVYLEALIPPQLVFLAEGRLDMPCRYSVDDLRYVPTQEAITDFFANVKAAPLVDAKKRILKRVIRRFLESHPQESRMGEFMRSFASIRGAFEADFALYESEFTFESLREKFDQKRAQFRLALNAATTDSLAKLLAIPIAQGLLVTQFKVGSTLTNSALVFASLIFALIAAAILTLQRQSVAVISHEIEAEKLVLRSQYSGLEHRIRLYDDLGRKVKTANCLPWLFGGLLLLMFILTLYVYAKVS